tara:strand:+ start:18550 stop:22197 length:3648 start_codon:yes stop_codon:yes gene_type:complete
MKIDIKDKRKKLKFLIYRALLKTFFFILLFSSNKASADNCQNIGERGTSGSCNGKLIVSRVNLDAAIAAGTYSVSGPDQNGNIISYTFAEGGAGDIYTGNITDFSKLFKGKRTFNQDIGYWDTSNGTNMMEMFANARRFNQDISNWDVSRVTHMNAMFINARFFNQDINNWDVSNVQQMNRMFREARRFNQSLNSWNVGNVTQMADMFRAAKVFNGNISSWDTSKVKNFIGTFHSAQKFNQDISNWNVTSATRMQRFLRSNPVFNQDLSGWDVRKIKNNPKHFAPKLISNGGKKPCWGLNGCSSINLIPVLDSYTPNDFDISHGNDQNLELNFNMAVEEKNRKSNIVLWKMNGSATKRVATYNLRNSQKVEFSDDKRKITINIGPKIIDNTKYYIIIKPGSIISASLGTSFPGIEAGFQESGSAWFSTGDNNSALDIEATTPSNGTTNLETENPKITIRFTEGISLGTGNITLKKYSDDSVIRAFNVANSTDQEDILINGTNLTLNLLDSDGDSLVISSTKYYLLIDATAIDNVGASKSFAGISDRDAYTYTTVSANNCGAITGKAKYWKGKGVASSSVKIYKEDSLITTLTTDDFGSYYYYPTETGTYHVEFVKPNNNSNGSLSTRAAVAIPTSASLVNSGRWVKNIHITAACEFHTDIDGLLIDPAGVIYDASTREPISGAVVKLLFNGELINNDWLDESGGENIQTTGSDGEYSFVFKADSAADGIYTIEVNPPTAYRFQSTQIPAETDTYSSQLGGSVEEIQSQETAPASDQDTTYYLAFSFVFTNEAASTSNGVINNHIPIDPAFDPTTKADVVGLADAWTQAAIRFNKASVNSVDRRLEWLRRNNKSRKRSHQGINISFANPLVDKAFNNSSKRLKDFGIKDIENWSIANWSNERLNNESDQVVNNLMNNSINVAMAELRDKTFVPNLNPTGGELVGDWSFWSNGQILVGEADSTSSTSKQESNSKYITLGVDRPFRENDLFGIGITYGEDDINVGNIGSGIDSKNLSLSVYSSNHMRNLIPLETQIGVGRMNMDIKRIDNSITHKGNREVNMIFGSAKILGKTLIKDNFQVTPYGRLDLAHINFNKFSESGSSLSLTFKDQFVNRKDVSVGLNIDNEIQFNKFKIKPFWGFEYGYDFTDNSVVDMNYVGDLNNYRLIIENVSDEHWNTNLGFEFFRGNNWSGGFSYEYENSGPSSYLVTYQFQINWYF